MSTVALVSWHAAAVLAAGASLGCTSLLGNDYQVGESAGAGGVAGSGEGGGGGTDGGAGGQAVAGNGGAGGAAVLECPEGLAGPLLVEIERPGGSYCIDSTEVTRLDYQAALEGGLLPPTDVPAECGFKAAGGSYVPGGDWPPTAAEHDLPVVRVDWCDAHAYCTAVGKRLCGRFGGGSLAPAQLADPSEAEWYFACSNGGTTTYPYGDMFESLFCNGMGAMVASPATVASFSECHGADAPLDEVFDLSGNAAEWINACNGTTGAMDTCARVGGNYTSWSGALACNDTDRASASRDGRSASSGFRCCADVAAH